MKAIDELMDVKYGRGVVAAPCRATASALVHKVVTEESQTNLKHVTTAITMWHIATVDVTAQHIIMRHHNAGTVVLYVSPKTRTP